MQEKNRAHCQEFGAENAPRTHFTLHDATAHWGCNIADAAGWAGADRTGCRSPIRSAECWWPSQTCRSSPRRCTHSRTKTTGCAGWMRGLTGYPPDLTCPKVGVHHRSITPAWNMNCAPRQRSAKRRRNCAGLIWKRWPATPIWPRRRGGGLWTDCWPSLTMATARRQAAAGRATPDTTLVGRKVLRAGGRKPRHLRGVESGPAQGCLSLSCDRLSGSVPRQSQPCRRLLAFSTGPFLAG